MNIVQLIIKSANAAPSLTPIETDESVESLFTSIMIKNGLTLLAAVAVGAIIYSGILFVLSQGDAEKLKKAKSALLWSIVGVLVISLSYGIVVYLSCLLKSSC